MEVIYPKGKPMIPYTVFKRDGRQFFEVQYVHPITGKKKTKSTKLAKKRDADRWAGKFIEKVMANNGDIPVSTTWKDFRETYEAEADFNSDGHSDCWRAVATYMESSVSPQLLSSITAAEISQLKMALRSAELAESTIKVYLSYLRMALNWAKKRKLLGTVPHFDMPKVDDKPPGRPLTTEEFERLLEAAESQKHAESWKWTLNCLWTSGLRLSEAMELRWNGGAVQVDLSEKYPQIRFAAKGHKGGRYELCPVSPEFAELLLSVPESDRKGFVLNPLADRPSLGRVSAWSVYSEVKGFSKAKNVSIEDAETGEKRSVTPHDFRRSFGSRWSKRVVPTVLMRLMRHKKIETTMAHYAVNDSQSVAEAAWQAVANTIANTSPENAVSTEE